ncbi:MAG TPA: hypothetical protein VFZ09_46925 [Archangium sp.]|uniref:hypothetical protein n=1 Tax=Archangium sp. TaxID=1872627 RepID=UPI002E33EE3E|nr:hypothetical protein [Archangium sp.]HEX5753809.1 hypothetical protein [Archangium sp.]
MDTVQLQLVYLGMYKLHGYGAYGSGSYLDPLGEPGRFLVGALARLPVLLGGLVLEVPADLWLAGEQVRPALVGVGLLGLGMMVPLVRAAWPRLSEDERRHGRWLFLGAALSLLPVAATFPSNRLLLVPGLGGSVAVALVLVDAWRSRARGWRPRGVAAGAAVLALMHLVLAPLLWPLMTLAFRQGQAQTEPTLLTLERELDYSRLPQQRLVVFPIPTPTIAMYIPMMMVTRGMPKPLAWWQEGWRAAPLHPARRGRAHRALRCEGKGPPCSLTRGGPPRHGGGGPSAPPAGGRAAG